MGSEPKPTKSIWVKVSSMYRGREKMAATACQVSREYSCTEATMRLANASGEGILIQSADGKSNRSGMSLRARKVRE